MKPKEKSCSIVSQRLRELRTTAGMTQQEVAEHLDLQRSTYAYYETGAIEPSLPVLQRIATEYRVTVGYILGNDDVVTTMPLHQNVHDPLEGAQLMRECTREERRFLSLLRRMNNKQLDDLHEFCLKALADTVSDELTLEGLEQHIHTVDALLPDDMRQNNK